MASPFKMKGFSGFVNSPLKQDYVKDRYHAKFNPSGTKGRPPKTIHQDVINKELTRIGKGGKAKADQMLIDAAKKRSADAAKKKASKSLLKRFSKMIGGKIFATAGMYLGSMSAAKADQPGPGGKSVMGTYNPKTEKYEK